MAPHLREAGFGHMPGVGLPLGVVVGSEPLTDVRIRAASLTVGNFVSQIHADVFLRAKILR